MAGNALREPFVTGCAFARQCATVIAIFASANSSAPKQPANATAITGNNGSLTDAKSASCDAPRRTPKKLHNTIRIILSIDMIVLRWTGHTPDIRTCFDALIVRATPTSAQQQMRADSA
ncbi:hypothetical protein LMG29542_00734 [Paraburkholderia humisilvae]|uniref:Uncharacterized protein n=1 Tax=Paraburkholderia humisilvae TaxID=627669 RepID=A0A6J5D384_9BURK|nr:hypothetical protein LMG29542_00734 [Paraburkholderia humisilvae]